MSNEKMLLEFNEEGFNDLVERKEKAKLYFDALAGYCEETLSIKIKNFSEFYSNPKEYCVKAYWEKYGSQFGNAPVKKEKAMQLTEWSDSEFQMLLQNAIKGMGRFGSNRCDFQADRINFKVDPEDFKIYLRKEDEDLYKQTAEFIDMANKMEQAGGKAAWYLARYYPSIAVKGNSLVHSKSYFKETPEQRKRNMFSTIS